MGSRAIPRLLCPELVGRDAELAVASQLIDATAAGKTATLVISGEAGIGKTALVRRIGENARRQGLRVLSAECMRPEIRRAFGPFVAALEPMRDRFPLVDEALQGIERRVDVPSVGEADRYRTHAALERAIAALLAERAHVLLIDDLQWADEASLELFAMLSRRATGAFLLVGAFRPAEDERRSALSRALRDLSRQRTWEVTLGALTASDVGRALRLILGPGRLNSSTRELLQARSGGNPLFLEEILRDLAERGDIEAVADGWRVRDLRSTPVPSTVREAVRERFRQFDDRARTVLITASIIGERFSFDVLVSVSGLGEAVVLAALRTAVDAQLATEAADDPTTFAFRHALIREAIREEPLALERRALHRSVAAAIEKRGGDDGQIAYHYDEAGDREKAFHFHAVAANSDLSAAAFAEALRHFERAIELAPHDDRVIADLQMGIAQSASVLQRCERQTRAARDAYVRFAHLGDVPRSALALRQVIEAAQEMAAPREERAQLVAQLVEIGGSLGDTPEAAGAFTTASREGWLVGDNDGAVAYGERAVAISERLGTRDSHAYRVLGLALSRTDPDRAVKTLRHALELAELNGAGEEIMWSAYDLAYASERIYGNTAEIAAVRARWRALIERHGTGHAIADRLFSVALAGRFAEFLEAFEDHVGDNRKWSSLAILRSALITACRGPEHAEPIEPLRQKLAASGMFYVVWAITGGSALVHLLAGRDAEALAAVEDPTAIGWLDLPIDHVFALNSMAIFGLIAARRSGDVSALDRWQERVRAHEVRYSGTAVTPFVSETWRFASAERAAEAGDIDIAIGVLSAIVDERRNIDPDRFDLPQRDIFKTHFVRMRLIELLMHRAGAGDRDTAQRELDEEIERWRTAGAAWYVTQIEKRVAELGLGVMRPHDDRRSHDDRLTRREREIASLIAEGLTNREIAERLTLSVRTAESHVEHIRSKLGLRTRAQIAAWVTERSALAN